MMTKEKLASRLELSKNYADMWDRYGCFMPTAAFFYLYGGIPNTYNVDISYHFDKNQMEKILIEKYGESDDFYSFKQYNGEVNGGHICEDDEIVFLNDDAIEPSINSYGADSGYFILETNLIFEYHNTNFRIYYRDIDFNIIENLVKSILESCLTITKKPKFHIIAKDNGGFYLASFEPKKQNIDINTSYNDDFTPINDVINSFIQNDNSGIVILHGKPGTGKTSYIRHLMGENIGCKFVYVSPDMMAHLSDPSFIPFILKHPNSILILEDCEEVLKSRNMSTYVNSGLINILEMSDGLLGDALKLKFICTFNADLKDIDEAISRKGRLVARYDFNELTEDKVRCLNKKHELGIPDDEIKPMTIGDVFHYKAMSFNNKKTKIGF